jgi:alanine racemase
LIRTHIPVTFAAMPIRPTEAVVDLAAIAHNYRLAVEAGGRPAIGVVKADAYGHGAARVARALVEAGAPLLAVALVEEGIELREAGIEAPVLVLGGAYGDAYEELVRHRLVPVVFTCEQVARLAAAARGLGVRAGLHVKLDTGMGRLGATEDEIPALAAALRGAPEVEVEGLLTHFASADLAPRATTERQIRRFEAAWEAFARAGVAPRLRHLANSAGTIEYAFVPQGLTRPGIMLYGYLPFDAASGPVPEAARGVASRLRLALRWRTAIVHVKEVAAGTPISYGGRWVAERPSRIATIPVGYADGYARRLSGRPGYGCGRVLVRGRRAPVAGTVCMDLTMIDVTDVPGAAVGDEVVLIGEQGGERIDADELARAAGTISYDVLCAIGKRVPRRYVP